MPESIPDNPEDVAKACMQDPPKKDWGYFSRWTENPFGSVNKTPEEQARTAKRDAELEELREKMRREKEEVNSPP